jgi:hypothetical protein
MSTNAPIHYVTKYMDRATQVFQAKGHMLRGTVTDPGRIEGNQAIFPIFGKGEAQPLARGGMGSAMNASRSTVTATISDWQAADWVWETDIEKMTVNEQEQVAEACGYACGRRSDLIIMNELNANSVTMIDGTGAPFTLTMLLAGMVAMQNNDVDFDTGDVICGLPPLQWAQFMSYKQVNDADWVGYDGLPYKAGAGTKFKDWNGVRFMRIPNSYAPVPSASNQDFFMWHKRAIGYGSNYEIRSTVTWENLFSGWYHNNRFAATAKVLLPTGVIRFRSASNSAITIN